MNFTATTTVAGGSSALARALIAAARPALQPKVVALGETGRRNIVARVGGLYGRRSGNRSRSASLHSPSNYIAQIVATPEGFRLQFRIQGDELFKAKFFSLNNGTTPHPIRPHGNYPLAFPWPNEGDPYVFRKSVRWRERGGKFGQHFYERAIAEAIAQFR